MDYFIADDTSPCPLHLCGHSQCRGTQFTFKHNFIESAIYIYIYISFFPGLRRGHVTRLGEFLVQFPLPPNLSCALIKAASLDCEDLLLPIAAMLSVENVFIRPGGKEKKKMKMNGKKKKFNFPACHALGVRALCVPGAGQQLLQRPQSSRDWVVFVPRLLSWKAASA